jgi:hypothetical protein
MLYTPMPGTPLYHESLAEGSLLQEVPYADSHGQFKLNFRHPGISRDESKALLDWAFRRDYEQNGPSVCRLFKTMMAGWRKYADHPDPRVRRRFRRERRLYQPIMEASLGAMDYRLAFENRPSLREQVRLVRQDLEKEQGTVGTIGRVGRWIGGAAAPILLGASLLDQLRVARGWRREPKTCIERSNWEDGPDGAT